MAGRWDETLSEPPWLQTTKPDIYWRQHLERSRLTPQAGLLAGKTLAPDCQYFSRQKSSARICT